MASSSSSLNWVYDVFLNFRGEDVRITFCSHFLKELDRKLITAFKDNEIERSHSLGPELVQAIRTSRIAVVIFSKNYASSSWCLNELLEIVNCNDNIVIPVFYGLDPSHVRNQTGDFGRIFQKTCKKNTEEKQNQWEKALTDVANLLGYHSVSWDDEAKMIEAIANDVLGKLLLTSSKDSEDLVGIEAYIAEMSLLLQLESKEVRMVGICGPSGIGKTTIARALFNRLSRHFQGSIFIDMAFISKSLEIYGRANPDDPNMKLHLQKLFLSEILGEKDIKIDHLDALGERLKHQKVLIIIDDLDDQVVLDTLVGQTQWFGYGSRIIVVTKDKHLLRAHGIDHIYEVISRLEPIIYNRCSTGMAFLVVINLLLEIASAVSDQLSSIRKPYFARISLVMSILSVVLSILDLTYKIRAHKARFRCKWPIPWFYYPKRGYRRIFGNFTDTVLLFCVVGSLITSTVNCSYIQKRREGPIKVSPWPLFFAIGMAVSKFMEKPIISKDY